MTLTFGTGPVAPAKRVGRRGGPKPGSMPRRFTPEEDALLIERYATHLLKDIAVALGRPSDAVCSRARLLARQGRIDPRTRAWHPRWTAGEVDVMHDAYGDKPDTAIAQATQRSSVAVRVKAKRLGIGARDNWLTGRQVAEILGCESHLPARWAVKGYLRMRQTPFRTAHGTAQLWRCEIADLERFLRERPECYEWRDIPDEPWRGMGQLAHRRADFLSLAEAAASLGVSASCLGQHIRKGWLPGVQRFRHGRGGRREWAIRRVDLAQFRPRLPAAIGHATSNRQRRSA